MSRMARPLIALVASALLILGALSRSADASLVGTTVICEFKFQPCTPALATVVDPGVEFTLFDPFGPIDPVLNADISPTSITFSVHESQPFAVITSFHFAFTFPSLEEEIVGVTVINIGTTLDFEDDILFSENVVTMAGTGNISF